MIKAPFTAEQVDALNRFQHNNCVHPFTCGNDHEGNRDLVAAQKGWICCHCDYTQDWAHAIMTVEPIDPLGLLRPLRP